MHTIVPGESSHQAMTSTALVAASLQLQQLNRSRSVSDRYPAFAAHAMSTSSQRGKFATLAGNQRQFSRSISAQDPENNAQNQTVIVAPAAVEEENGHGIEKSLLMSAAGGWNEAYAGGSSSAGPQMKKDVDLAAAKANRDQGGRAGAIENEILPAATTTSTRSPLQTISNNPRRPMLHQARTMGQLRSPPKGFLNLPSESQNEDQKITGRPSLQNSPLRERRCKQPLSIKAPPPPSLASASASSGATTPTTLLRRPRARSVTSSSYIYSPPPCPPPTTPLPELPPNSAMFGDGGGGGGGSSASGSRSKHSMNDSNSSTTTTTTTSSETPLSSIVAITPYKSSSSSPPHQQQSSDDKNTNKAAERGWLQDERTPPPPPPLVLSASSDYSCSSSPSPASATSSKYSPIGLRLHHGQDMQRGISAPAHPTTWTRSSIDFTKDQGSGGTTNNKAIPWSHNQDYIFDRLGLSFAQQLDQSTTKTPTIAQNDAATNAMLHSRISLDVHTPTTTTTTKEDIYDDNLHVYGLAM